MSTQQELWEKRQLLYRLYDIEDITQWKARDLLTLYELFEEYELADILANGNNGTNTNTNTNTNGNDNGSGNGNNNSNNESILYELNRIKTNINESIKKASKDKDFKAKAILTKKLDKVLTLIALVESKNREGLTRITSMYRLLKRYEELRNALQDIANGSSSSNDSNFEPIMNKVRAELEREIIELKKQA
jgi:DNA-binding ferritin-like protein